MRNHSDFAPETVNAQALRQIDSATGGLTPAIFPSTTYVRDENYALLDPQRSYGRDGNPGFVVAEKVLARLEGGEAALLFSSGMSAAMAIIQSLKPGDKIVAPRIMYWGLRKWLITFCDQWGLELDLFDPADPRALTRTLERGKMKLLWIETPCNPTWDVTDIAAAADVAHDVGATLVVDSTVPTPVLTQPIRHGADLVVHSATKYLNGHCDVVAGAVVTARRDELWERICQVRLHGGAILGLSRPGCCKGACARFFCGCGKPRSRHWQSHGISRDTPRSRPCCTPACPATPDMKSPGGKWTADSAACCRSE